MSGRFEGRSVIVTGVASGLGSALAQEFAAEGAQDASAGNGSPFAAHSEVSHSRRGEKARGADVFRLIARDPCLKV